MFTPISISLLSPSQADPRDEGRSLSSTAPQLPQLYCCHSHRFGPGGGEAFQAAARVPGRI